MDWLILIFLIPLVLIPLVFLAGFAGCGFSVGVGPSTAPSDLVATAISSTEINLEWTDSAPMSTASFRIARSENGAPAVDPTTPGNQAPGPGASRVGWHDSGLKADTVYEYQVFAIVANQESAGSNMASATTFAIPFAIAYNIPLTTDDPGWEGNTIVERLDAGHITSAGTKVRLTLRGSTVANLVINKVAISQAATAGQAWNSAADLVEVRFAGASGVTISANQIQTSDVTNYNLVLGKDLIIAFDISLTDGSARRATLPGPTEYYKQNTAEAAAQNRSANYLTHAGRAYIVEKIEVLP